MMTVVDVKGNVNVVAVDKSQYGREVFRVDMTKSHCTDLQRKSTESQELF